MSITLLNCSRLRCRFDDRCVVPYCMAMGSRMLMNLLLLLLSGAVRDSREENMQGLEDNEARRTLGEVDSPFL